MRVVRAHGGGRPYAQGKLNFSAVCNGEGRRNEVVTQHGTPELALLQKCAGIIVYKREVLDPALPPPCDRTEHRGDLYFARIREMGEVRVAVPEMPHAAQEQIEEAGQRRFARRLTAFQMLLKRIETVAGRIAGERVPTA